MSVLIKGMEMPKNCLQCYCIDTEYGECVLDPEKRCPEDYRQRAEWCPLIKLPSPHGKLIDVSSLDPYNDMWKRKCIPMETVYNARAVAYEAPAILEAEEGET